MKKILLLTFVFVMFCGSIKAEKIEWLYDFKKAKVVADETGKPMLLDFTAKWCEPCQSMDATFWVRPDVVALSKRFVPVKIDFDNSSALKAKYRIKSIPFVLATDSWGLELASVLGFDGTGRTLMNRMKMIPSDFSEIKSARYSLLENKKDVESLNTLAAFYQNHKFYFQSNEYNKMLLKALSDSSKREGVMLKMGINYLRVGMPDKAKKIFKKFRKEFPESKKMDVILYGEIVMHTQKKKVKNAEKLLKELKTNFPNSKYIGNASQTINAAKRK